MRLWIHIRHGCHCRDSEGACTLGRGTRQQRLRRRHQDSPFCKVAPGGATSTVTAAPRRAHLPRVRHYRRRRCLPLLGHPVRLYHHALPPARVSISTPCQRPHAARIGRAGIPLSRTHIPVRGPRSGPQCRGTICFSDPQHIEVWRLPAAPPPLRDHLQFRFISADYPTAGQKRRLTTRHRP